MNIRRMSPVPPVARNDAKFEELRRKAESMLDDDVVGGQAESIKDIRELIQQLNVYQIELELQNEELVAAQTELQRSRDKYLKLYDFAPTAYFTFDEEGLVREANLAGARLLGLERNFIHRKPFIAYVESESQQTFYIHRMAVFKSGEPQTCTITLETRSGEQRVARLHSTLLEEDAPASLQGPHEDLAPRRLCLSAVEDITDLELTRRELLAAKTAAETASQAKNDFMARMSHELRTPLHGILGLSRVILESELEEAQAHHLEMVTHSAETLLHIVNDILDVSKVEMGVLALEKRPFSLRALLRESLASFEVEAQRKGLRFESMVEENVPDALHGDPNRIRQILTNLVSNAVKFTPRGQVRVRVEELPVQGRRDSVMVRFEVADSGVGIPQALRDRVFDRFYQVDGSYSRAFEGAGLGLAIAKHLTEMMDGCIDFDSAEGQGSVFHFVLPMEQSTQSEAASTAHAVATTAIRIVPASSKHAVPCAWGKATPSAEASPNADAAASPSSLSPLSPSPPASPIPEPAALPRLTVLLAEDNVVNQAFAQLILHREGHEVVTVGNGAEALEALARRRFDVVLMDVRMPGMDGVEATRRIRAGQDNVLDPEIPIIALTAHGGPEDVERFHAAGMDHTIAKPMSWEAVFVGMAQALAARGRTPAPHSSGAVD